MAGSWLRGWGRGRARRGQDRLGWVLRAASVDGVLRAASVDGMLFAASVDGMLRAASVDGVLFAASVGRALSPSSRVVVLLKSDFLAYFC